MDISWMFSILILTVSTIWVFLQRRDAIQSIHAVGKTLADQLENERKFMEERVQREWERSRAEVEVAHNRLQQQFGITTDLGRILAGLKIQTVQPAQTQKPQTQTNGVTQQRPPMTLEPDNMDA